MLCKHLFHLPSSCCSPALWLPVKQSHCWVQHLDLRRCSGDSVKMWAQQSLTPRCLTHKWLDENCTAYIFTWNAVLSSCSIWSVFGFFHCRLCVLMCIFNKLIWINLAACAVHIWLCDVQTRKTKASRNFSVFLGDRKRHWSWHFFPLLLTALNDEVW